MKDLKNIKMYISTCDATMFFLPLFSYFFEKYWIYDNDVKVLGFKKPDFILPKRFEYISLNGEQIGGVNNWSTYLRNYFNNINDEIILWGIDDHLIVDYLDVKLLNYFYNEMLKDENIGRIGLTYGISKRQHKIIEKYESCNIIELTQCEYNNGPFAYRIDCNFGFWRKNYLLKYLINNLTPWQFEVEGSKVARNDGYKILSSSINYCIHKVEGKRGIMPGKINLLGVKFYDILQIIDKNLINKKDIVGMQDWL